ncbi:uncharacterized protein EV154DRAFT_507025 [Mucor mucedo]|uniref:uncharacterized protein n=1 Tax=Mucor mucedo TaxID=29922 RepID=UPI0022208A52|nr:uncharacterized protein EV154DRAFT_507025 [Mucor mucedo]KAI7891725.1 hypothetical protein EV154DRAFT_507025 [Mucor mucedo]
MLGLRDLFSIKGIVSISLLTFLVWLLGDYSQWKAKRSNTDSVTITTATATAATASAESETTTAEEEKQKSIEKLSLAHYILVSPFAAIYILGRVILDAIRYSLYYAIWWCEKSMPYIDDWLYDTMTIWVPQKYNQLESWWVRKGKPGFILRKQYFLNETLPTVVEHCEITMVKAYQIGCIVASSAQDFIDAWKRFVQRHDWRQLVTDLSDVACTVIWNPSVWIVTRSIRLAKLVYHGLRSASISIRDDILWVSTVILPSIYNYMATTRLAKLLIRGLQTLTRGIHYVCLGVHGYLLVPTLGRFLTWLVKSIDLLILLLQDHTLQQRLWRVYQWTAPNLVWSLVEVGEIVTDIARWMQVAYVELLQPAYVLFMKRVVPRLAIAYQEIVVRWVYELHLYPAWVNIYPYLNGPLLWAYTNLTVPVLNGVYRCVASVSAYVTQHSLVKLQAFLSMAIEISVRYSQTVYTIVQSWLIRQAPVLSSLIQKSYTLMINACDWNGLRQDTLIIISQLYTWTSHQSDMIYLSLERSLSNWAKEQGVKEKEL